MILSLHLLVRLRRLNLLLRDPVFFNFVDGALQKHAKRDSLHLGFRMVTFSLRELALSKIYMIVAFQILIHLKELSRLTIRLLIQLPMHQTIFDLQTRVIK